MAEKPSGKDLRIVLTDAESEIFEKKFLLVCAMKGQTVRERIAELIEKDVVTQSKNKAEISNEWLQQADMIDALVETGFSITRQTLHNHRSNQVLPKELFIESADESKTNRKIFYNKNKTIEFYKTFFANKN